MAKSSISLLLVPSLTPLSVEGERGRAGGGGVGETERVRVAAEVGRLEREWDLLRVVELHISLKTGVIQLAQQGSPLDAYTFVSRLNFCKDRTSNNSSTRNHDWEFLFCLICVGVKKYSQNSSTLDTLSSDKQNSFKFRR